jgi:Predicted membrane protein
MGQDKNTKYSAKSLAFIGLSAALVFAGSWIQIPIPTAINNTRLHLGNVMCLLAGLLFGPVPGGLAAGIGSGFFDLTNPLYIADAPITFATKFAMAWICGKIAWRNGAKGQSAKQNIPAAATGAILYLFLYLLKNFVKSYFFLHIALPTIWIDLTQRAITSGINGLIAAVAAVPLAATLQRALSRNRIEFQR